MVSKPSHNGPGRGTPRSRAVARPRPKSGSRPGATPAGQAPRTAGGSTRLGAPRRLIGGVITRRLAGLLVVVLVLAVSYTSSIRVYLRQETDLAEAQQQIAERTTANAELAAEVERWKDTDFVRTQARERLGWVMPGEVGYRVVGPDGKPLGGGVTITSTSTVPEGEHATAWWDRLGGSLAAADEPLVAPTDSQPVITAEDPDASASPTPSATPTR